MDVDHTIAEMRSYLCMTVIRPENPVKYVRRLLLSLDEIYAPRPLGPRIVSTPRSRRFREEFEVRNRLRTVSHRSPNTIVAGVSSPDDNDILAFGIDITSVFQVRVEERFCIQLTRCKS